MATKTKEKEPVLKVRIVGRTPDREEVSITSDASEGSTDPYVNRMVYAKPGVFTDGDLSADAVAKLEAKSTKALEDDHAALLAKEAKEREAAAKAEPAKQEG